nr:hypothetical protein [Candidatus Sigynarchaeum springense]
MMLTSTVENINFYWIPGAFVARAADRWLIQRERGGPPTIEMEKNEENPG